MNPLTQIRQIKKINERELQMGIAGEGKSWHDDYKDSAWVFVGGLNFDLTEGDVISVFSQYGEVVNMNMVRDPKTGKSRGFAFICYEDQRSTVLAVDNLNGIKVVGRTIRVDHVANYRPPKEKEEIDELTRLIYERGCGPEINMQKLEEEAAKREANKSFDKKSGEKRPFDNRPMFKRNDRNDRPLYRGPAIKEEKADFDEDGDIRRGPPRPVKAEFDEDGDIRTAPRVKLEYDDDGDIRRGPSTARVDYDDDGDIALGAKRRSIAPERSREPRRHEPSQNRDDRRDHNDRLGVV